MSADMILYLTGQLHDDSSLASSVLWSNVGFLVVVVAMAGLRMYVRAGMLHTTGLDDILMIIASVAALFFSAACLAGYHYGLGNHLWKLTPNVVDLPDAVSKIVICIFSSIIPYNTALCFSKLSICASYLRHFTDRWIRRSIMFTAVVLISLCISIIFATIFNCLPVASDWDYSIRGICSDPRPTFYVGATITLITDLFLCILPLPILWKLHLPIAQKCVVCILFSMGTFSSIASIIRMTYLHNMGSFDIGYAHAAPLNWSLAEIGAAIFCGSASTLRPLAEKLVPGFSLERRYNSSNSYNLQQLSVESSAAPSSSPTDSKNTMHENRLSSAGTATERSPN